MTTPTDYPTEIHYGGKVYAVEPLVHGGVPCATVNFTVTTPTGKVYTMSQRHAGENVFMVKAPGRKTPFTLAWVEGNRWTATTIYNKSDRFS